MAQREIPFRDKKIETAPREVIEWMQLDGLKQQIDHALKTEFYGKRYRDAGITSERLHQVSLRYPQASVHDEGRSSRGLSFRPSCGAERRSCARARVERHDRNADRHLSYAKRSRYGERHYGPFAHRRRRLETRRRPEHDDVRACLPADSASITAPELLGAMVMSRRARATRFVSSSS